MTVQEPPFDASTIGRLLTHFEVLLAAVTANPELPLSRCALLTEGERAARFCVAKAQQENRLTRFSNREVPVREQTLAGSLRRGETVRSETVE